MFTTKISRNIKTFFSIRYTL